MHVGKLGVEQENVSHLLDNWIHLSTRNTHQEKPDLYIILIFFPFFFPFLLISSSFLLYHQ